MGCDIHVMVEARRYPFGTEKWFNVDNWRYNPWYSAEDGDGECNLEVKPIYTHRDYELFSFSSARVA